MKVCHRPQRWCWIGQLIMYFVHIINSEQLEGWWLNNTTRRSSEWICYQYFSPVTLASPSIILMMWKKDHSAKIAKPAACSDCQGFLSPGKLNTWMWSNPEKQGWSPIVHSSLCTSTLSHNINVSAGTLWSPDITEVIPAARVHRV